MIKYISLFLSLLLLFTGPLAAVVANAQESLVSVNETTGINEAIQILEIYALRETSKKIINMSAYSGPIGIPVSSLPWRKALDIIALKNGLLVEESAGFRELLSI